MSDLILLIVCGICVMSLVGNAALVAISVKLYSEIVKVNIFVKKGGSGI